ncbi:MAG: WcbI family polysaccharide biosynthesis putative acetyltransferase, partial [Asticcacaulis sp.]
QKWLFISTCQTNGLARSMRLLSPDLELDSADIWTLRANLESYNARCGEYDKVVIAPEIDAVEGFDLESARSLAYIPPLNFSAYHPDLTYVHSPEGILNSPAGAYHSLIALAAHQKGLDIPQTLSLFNSRIYEDCGYFDFWIPHRNGAVEYFASYGLDISAEIRRWGRGDAFMYSVNHPKIRCLHDIARIFLETHGVLVRPSDLLPPDELSNAMCYPVYPELGEALGVKGDYLFKCHFADVQYDLTQFVAASFARYDEHPRGSLTAEAGGKLLYDHVYSVI